MSNTGDSPNRSETVCAICREAARFYLMKDDFAFYRCSRCGFIFVHPAPSDTTQIYSEDYFSGATSGFGYVDYENDKVAMVPFFTAVLDTLENLSSRRGTLLDVGAATGFFMKLASGRGWQARGLEVSPYAVKTARASNLDISQGTLESVALPGNYFDAITMLDLLEHVSQPIEALRLSSGLLRRGGILFINTPDTASWWAKFFGRRWHAYCPPEHLSYFNSQNLCRLLINNSFEIVATGKIAKRFTPAYVFSMLGRWQALPFWQILSEKVEGSLLNRLSLPVNLRDNFFIAARKI